jgi:hypothetical protein
MKMGRCASGTAALVGIHLISLVVLLVVSLVVLLLIFVVVPVRLLLVLLVGGSALLRRTDLLTRLRRGRLRSPLNRWRSLLRERRRRARIVRPLLLEPAIIRTSVRLCRC